MGLGGISAGIVMLFMFVLAVLLTKHYIRGRKTHTFWWAISFWLAFLAAAMDFASYVTQGWTLLQFRVYLFAAATLVAYMGAGTIYLFSKKLGNVYVLLMTLVALSMCYSLAITPVEGIATFTAGEHGLAPKAIGIYFAILSGIGAVALFVGAIFSWYRSKRSFNLWIALGALIFSAGGVADKYIGIHELFYVCQALGSLVLYYGITSGLSKHVPSRSV